MEQSNNKRASNMLRVVSLLCIILIVAITVFTFTSNKENDVKDDVSKTRESAYDSVSQKDSVQSESVSDTEALSKEEKSTDALKEEETQKKEEAEKSDESVKPTAVTQKLVYELPVVGSITKGYAVDIPVYSLTMNDY